MSENRETYTAYQGAPVWEAIYAENCDCSDNLSKQQKTNEEECSEQTLLYQMMSGLHCSINTHISASFENPITKQLEPNMTYFSERIGSHEDRIKNMYLIYAATLKAVKLMEPSYLKQVYNQQSG